MGELIAFLAITVSALLAVAGVAARRRWQAAPVREAFEDRAGRLNETCTRAHALGDSLRRSSELIRSGFASDEAEPVLSGLDEALSEADALLKERDRLADRYAALTRWSPHSELVAVARRWEDLEGRAERALGIMRAAEERASRALATSTALADEARETGRRIEQVRASAEQARAQGYVVDGETSVLKSAHDDLSEVQGLVAEGRPLTGGGALSDLSSKLSAASSALQALKEREARAGARLGGLEEDLRGLRAQHAASEEAAEELIAGFAPAVADGMENRLRHGERWAAQAEERVAAARSALEQRDVHSAEQDLAAAESAHRTAADAFRSPLTRLGKVRELALWLPRHRSQVLIQLTELAERAASDKGTRHLSRIAYDLRARVESLDMDGDRPDWLELESRLNEAEVLGHTIADASSEVLGVIDEIRTALRDAERELTRTRERARALERQMR
ncbi:coiled-coil domain-containing protein [Nocardiopsis suaedae]|uniref:Uncharacterized protein n=1 Tax=Nocardiopsis suaedae TaxID=3018444 RepID=A0ABT4TP74_9ACTN|nr:hypothetical protein [Nocardiopsis suaedae]MDA2806486.1 hypothetical protein [Nocardiopsis suaedae]